MIPVFETKTFIGQPIRTDLKGFQPYYGTTQPEAAIKWEDEFHYNRLVKRYGKNAVETAINHVKREFPHLVNAIPRTRFWGTVGAILVRWYGGSKESWRK